MPRLILVTAAIAVLAGSGVAAARLATRGTSAVSATFAATQASNVQTRTCAGSDGTYEIQRGTYAGTATSTDPRLNGTLRLKVRSVYETTKDVGLVTGKALIESSAGCASARLAAVNANGSLSGALEGAAGKPRARLLAISTAGTSE